MEVFESPFGTELRAEKQDGEWFFCLQDIGYGIGVIKVWNMKKENEAEITWDEIVKRHAEYMNSKNKLEKIMFVTILIRFIIFCRKKIKEVK